MKRSLCLLLALVLIGTLCACGRQAAPASAAEASPQAAAAPSAEAAPPAEEAAPDDGTVEEKAPGLRHAEITIRGYGTVRLELDTAAAPITVENFCALAQAGFYDGLTFHRIMDGFMIQGGDPNGNGSGGSEEKIRGEFASNGVDNPISHVKGVISMARTKDPNSASSQFFITVADATFLDGNYAAFGRVTEGMELVEQIAKDARPIDNNGTIPRDQQPVIESIVITD